MSLRAGSAKALEAGEQQFTPKIHRHLLLTHGARRMRLCSVTVPQHLKEQPR